MIDVCRLSLSFTLIDFRISSSMYIYFEYKFLPPFQFLRVRFYERNKAIYYIMKYHLNFNCLDDGVSNSTQSASGYNRSPRSKIILIEHNIV